MIEEVYTLPLGAVRMTERFEGCAEHDDDSAYIAMRDEVRSVIKDLMGKPPFAAQFIVGTGGTFTCLAAISMHRGAAASSGGMLPFAVRGYEMQRSEIKHTLEWLRGMAIKQRARVPGMAPDRSEIIIAGTVIAESVMKRLGANSVKVHDRGIRDGLVLTMIAEVFPRAPEQTLEPLDRLRSARQFGARCRYEERHSNHVAELAVQIFDQLVAQRPESLGEAQGSSCRELLLAASVLHDVGYFINYSKHHKHSYHLIVHSDLPGFTHRELEIVANVARYHRGAEPKPRHPGLARLSEGDRQMAVALSAILRVADGLDRTHTQAVRDVELRAEGESALITVCADEEPEVDIWGSHRKSRLFSRRFGLSPRYLWTRGSRAGAPLGEAAQQAQVNGAAGAGPVVDRTTPLGLASGGR